MLLGLLIRDQKDLWWKMGITDNIINLFDTSTYGIVNYEPIVDLVHGKVVTHPLNHQRQENYIQMTVSTASTNVGKGRRTDRSGDLSYLMRPFNRDTVEKVKERCACGKEPWKKEVVN